MRGTSSVAQVRASPTIDDVARLAGVSRATASRALFNERRPVSAARRERVLAAAAELGYRVNPLARSLTTKTVNLVAVMVNHVHDLSDLDLFDRLITETQGIGKQVILLRTGSEGAVEELRRGVAYHVDAALVFSDFADAGTARHMFHSDHVLMLNGRHDGRSPAVIPNEAVGIDDAVADAARKGVRTAALVTGRASSLVEQARIAHYLRALAGQGIALSRTIQGDYSYPSGCAAGEALAASPGLPDAVFCTSDAAAMGVLDSWRADFPEGRPARFRLYGFDDISLLGSGAYPISSIGYDKAAFVREVMRFLGNPVDFVGSPVLVPTRFVPRLTG